MSTETDTTSEVARVLGAHEWRAESGGVRCRCGALLPTVTEYHDHQAAMLAEAGLLRDRAALATAFESGARSYAASDPCCGTYHLHEIENPHTGETIPTREGEDDL